MTPYFTNMINEEYRNINKYTPVSILHANRCDNLTGDMSNIIMDTNIIGKIINMDIIYNLLQYSF
jgi:hypothetical protein